MSVLRKATLLLLALAGLAPPAARAEAPLEFNYGMPSANHSSIYVAQDLGLFEKAGLKPKFYYFASGAPLLAGLKGESLDVVSTGIALAFALGQGIPLKFLFWEANSSTSEGLVVNPASGIKSFADLGKARKIGAAVGTCAQVALYVMAKKAGIDYAKPQCRQHSRRRCSATRSSASRSTPASPGRRSRFSCSPRAIPSSRSTADYAPPGGICPAPDRRAARFPQGSIPRSGLKLVQAEALARTGDRRRTRSSPCRPMSNAWASARRWRVRWCKRECNAAASRPSPCSSTRRPRSR